MDGMAVIKKQVELTFDAEADAGYIYLDVASGRARASVARTRFCNIDMVDAAINVDFDEDGHVVGIEFLGASQLFAERVRSNN
jgi:uncharacterized protein YuzE